MDFSNGATTPASNGQSEATNFANPNVNTNGNEGNSGDNAVVLELNGRKFTREDLIRKLTSADEFIETLKKERQEDRALLEQVNAKLSESVNAAELLNKLKQGEVQPETQAQQPAPVDPDAITAAVLSKLTEKQVQQQRDANWDNVTSQLTSIYGDKTNVKVAEVAKENNLTLAEAAELARNKPNLFLKLFPELSAKPKSGGLLDGSRNTQSFVKQPKGPSGFTAARTTKDSVSVYLKRLQELSGQ